MVRSTYRKWLLWLPVHRPIMYHRWRLFRSETATEQSRTGGESETSTPHIPPAWVTPDPEVINDLEGWLMSSVCGSVCVCVCVDISTTQQTANRWNQWVLCKGCFTSVHDTAEGFGGVGLRKSQADVAKRIRNTLHRPDDTCTTGLCLRFDKAQRISGCSIPAMDSIKYINSVIFL